VVRRSARSRPVFRVFVLLCLWGAALAACATAPAIGRGGKVYQVRVATVDGMPTALRGPVSHPACVLQVADRVAPVWLARASHGDQESPVVFEADGEALKEGILVERSWSEAVVHRVTDAELAIGVAVVYVPSARHPTTVELHFDPTSRLTTAQTASTTLPNTARDSSNR
jgi:hypothetical protein